MAPLNDGYIINSRYLCSFLAIDSTGNVLWRVSGRDGADFTLDPGTNFCYQHDIRVEYQQPRTYTATGNITVHLHDNANCPINNGTTPTSGLHLHVDVDHRTVSLARRYLNPKNPLYALAQGNYQHIQSANHVFLGHGFIPYIEEFDGDGNIVETIQFGNTTGSISYRAFRQEWVGCPKQAPLYKATQLGAGQIQLFMSWNGATEYDAWHVTGIKGDRGYAATVAKCGFETNVTVPLIGDIKVYAITPLSKLTQCKGLQEYTLATVVS